MTSSEMWAENVHKNMFVLSRVLALFLLFVLPLALTRSNKRNIYYWLKCLHTFDPCPSVRRFVGQGADAASRQHALCGMLSPGNWPRCLCKPAVDIASSILYCS